MAEIKLGGDTIKTSGNLPAKGDTAPEFTLIGTDMSECKLSDFRGKKVILNIFPSIDTNVCAKSVREFNERAVELENTVVMNISKDLPFAHKRFCAVEGIENARALSEFRDNNFSRDYNVEMMEGKLKGLMSRAVVVIDEHGMVVHSQQVPDIGEEPDYKSALVSVLKN